MGRLNSIRIHPKGRSTSRWKALGAVISILMCADLACSLYYYLLVSDFLGAQDLEGPYDSAVVFFRDSGMLQGVGAETYQAITTAANLYRAGVVKNIICVGGWRKQNNPHGSRNMKEILLIQGIPNTCVFSDSLSYDSITNWREARNIIKRIGWRRILLISSPIHEYRLFCIASKDTISLAAYSIRGERLMGGESIFSSWQSIQKELIAWCAMKTLSQGEYDRLIHLWRD